jgi:hypothetical protein
MLGKPLCYTARFGAVVWVVPLTAYSAPYSGDRVLDISMSTV